MDVVKPLNVSCPRGEKNYKFILLEFIKFNSINLSFVPPDWFKAALEEPDWPEKDVVKTLPVLSGRFEFDPFNPDCKNSFYIRLASRSIWGKKNNPISFMPLFSFSTVLLISGVSLHVKKNKQNCMLLHFSVLILVTKCWVAAWHEHSEACQWRLTLSIPDIFLHLKTKGKDHSP